MEPCAIAIENAILFQRTEQLTITDDLTKLFNSRYLNLYIGARDQALQAPRHPAVGDLPRPRRLQERQRPARPPGRLAHPDRGGRHPGARRCASRDILARYGGDEFVVVLPETPPSGALVIAERIRKAIESHRFLQDQGLEARISASFGIASYPDHALTPEGLIQKADQAMYRVKERDKNGIEVAV